MIIFLTEPPCSPTGDTYSVHDVADDTSINMWLKRDDTYVCEFNRKHKRHNFNFQVEMNEHLETSN